MDISIDTHAPTCAPGSCTAGAIGSKQVKVKDWHDAVQRFEGKIELWNELTKRHAIPHIGFVQPFKFCPDCGRSVDHEALAPSRSIRVLVDALLLVADSPAVLGCLGAEERLAWDRAVSEARCWEERESSDG